MPLKLDQKIWLNKHVLNKYESIFHTSRAFTRWKRWKKTVSRNVNKKNNVVGLCKCLLWILRNRTMAKWLMIAKDHVHMRDWFICYLLPISFLPYDRHQWSVFFFQEEKLFACSWDQKFQWSSHDIPEWHRNERCSEWYNFFMALNEFFVKHRNW